ncbi:MAG: imidazole glycerol phosphate synthase subunit HisH [Blastocatellia bacterium]|nr:imidazole glycerol phosphate synthase subunit HisH [Blastocatellia bacterium]
MSFVIIDYGAGNLRSVEKAFKTVISDIYVSSDVETVASADAIVLPGVGAFGDAIKSLTEKGFSEAIHSAVASGTPLLGVCLGYQLLFEESQEFGVHKGLGLLPGRVVRFAESHLPVPHVGWNRVKKVQNHPILSSIDDGAFFYFVHSYYVEPGSADDTIGLTEYGLDFASIAGRGRVVGVQFHPEKSQHVGLQLLKNFALSVQENIFVENRF